MVLKVNLTGMKTIIKAAALAISALVAFSSCLKEQSSLTIDDIPGKAKVTGTLVIYEGTDYVDGNFVSLKKPAANTEVTAKIDNGSFTSGGGRGTTDFTVQTDENGYFEIVIPAVSGGVRFMMSAPPFKGDFKVVKGSKDGEVVVENQPGVYSINTSETYFVEPGQIREVLLEYSHEKTPSAWHFDAVVPLHVYVGKAYASPTEVKRQDIIENGSSYRYNGEILPASKVSVNLEVTYNELGHTEMLSGTSDSKGFIEFAIPAVNVENMYRGAVSLSLHAPEHLGTESFTYYTWVTNQLDYTRSTEESCSLPAGTYTFAHHEDNCESTYDFRFFTPVVKVVMWVSQVNSDKGILSYVDADSYNDEYYTVKYQHIIDSHRGEFMDLWNLDNFATDK